MDCTWAIKQVVAKGSHQCVSSLNKQQELEALGLLLTLPIIASILMHLEVSEFSSPLGWCCTDLPIYIEMTTHQLSKTQTTQKCLTTEMFDRLENMAGKKIINLPPASCLQETKLVWEKFESTVFFHFIHELTSETKRLLRTSSSGFSHLFLTQESYH